MTEDAFALYQRAALKARAFVLTLPCPDNHRTDPVDTDKGIKKISLRKFRDLDQVFTNYGHRPLYFLAGLQPQRHTFSKRIRKEAIAWAPRTHSCNTCLNEVEVGNYFEQASRSRRRLDRLLQ